ncbi:MAG: membrane protein insertase YidC [Flavobacteriales bacterium]|nr:membrane protein insertase YidC [Flavobacteriales bacterium]
MQQERKFDSNTLIGFILIGLILIGFSTYNYYNKSEESEQINTSQTKQNSIQSEEENQTAKVQLQDSATVDSNNQAEQLYSFENEKLELKFTSLGGQLKEVKLKEFNAYSKEGKDHHKELFLIKGNSASFGYTFKTKEGKLVDTRNLYFSANQDSPNKITFTTRIADATINYVYTLKKDYSLDFEVQTSNLYKITNDNLITLNHHQKAFALEKGRSQENTYTEFNYSYENFAKDDYWQSKSFEEEEKIDWIAIKQQFFATVLEPKNKLVNTKGTPEVIKDENSEFIKDFSYTSEVAFQNDVKEEYTWYFVPLKRDLLKSYGKNFEDLIPFGWGIFGWLNIFFLWMYKTIGSAGIAAGWIIFLMTIIVKLITSPIMYKQHLQSAMMRVLKPELEELNEKNKNADALKKQQATMELYRKAGVNPMAGCLPALLQMPIFISLYRFFPNVFDLRGKSFLWADDLTAYDSITTLPFNIPFYGDHVSLFTIMYCAVLLIYTRMTASNMQQPTQEGMPDMRVMMYIMPLMFIFILNSLASGLSWYYFVSNAINIIIILFIKNFLIDEKKIHQKMQANKAKPKKKGKWQARMQEMMEKAQEQQKLQQQGKK